MTRKLVVGALCVVLGVGLATACSSSKSNSSGSGGSAGAATGGTGGSGARPDAGGSGAAGGNTGGTAGSSGGSGGQKDAGSNGGSGGTLPYADADLDAPYQFPDGGCGQGFCQAVVNAQCQRGFTSLDECSTFCTKVAQSPCETEWNDFLTCAGPNPDVTCNSSTGLLEVKGCESQFQTFYNCQSTDAG